MSNIPIENIYISEKFTEDYDRLDKKLKKSVDRFVVKLDKMKMFPNSAKKHGAHSTDYAIAYVRVSKPHLRVLAFVDGSTVTLDRIILHDPMDRLLKDLSKT